jgi:hypothetical protein
MKTLIPMSSADLTAADVQAVAEVVRTGRLSRLPHGA